MGVTKIICSQNAFFNIYHRNLKLHCTDRNATKVLLRSYHLFKICSIVNGEISNQTVLAFIKVKGKRERDNHLSQKKVILLFFTLFW